MSDMATDPDDGTVPGVMKSEAFATFSGLCVKVPAELAAELHPAEPVRTM